MSGRLVPSCAYFAVEPSLLKAVVTNALDGTAAPDSDLQSSEWALAAFLGIAKPAFVGDRWSPLVPPDTWDSVDSYDLSPARVMPVERLLRCIAGRLRFLGAIPEKVVGSMLVALGLGSTPVGELLDGVPLSRRLDPPQPPDHVASFPPELGVLDRSRARLYREVVTTAVDSYGAANATTASEIAELFGMHVGNGADRVVFSSLGILLSACDALEAGDEVLVGQLL